VAASRSLELCEVDDHLGRRGVPLRYVASARYASQRLAPPLDLDEAAVSAASDWPLRERALAPDEDHPHRWFLGDDGVHAERGLSGTGVGARLAVIDNDGGRTAGLDLDALLPVARALPDPQSLSCHGATLVAWAVGAREPRFAGVAPGASPRLYCIPKPGGEVLALPLAIARAAFDGADVIACATYVEGSTSPMLDDALEVATRLGRGGLGAALVFAAGREICSPDRLVPSSLSLDLGDPGSDPRVFCIAPSGRDGAWFLFHDRRGKLRPFANRGPAVRFMAPGEDAADPFAPQQLRHTESSGATAFAAGVMLLVLATAPELDLAELEAILRATTRRTDPAAEVERIQTPRARELLPRATDRDGHNAKHGYGRLDAAGACCAARDPLALALALLGEGDAARAWIRRRARDGGLGALLSPSLGRALVRALLTSERLRHGADVLVRHARLVAGHPARARAHAPGAVLRHLALLLRDLASRVPAEQTAELAALADRARMATASAEARARFDARLLELCDALWPEAAERQVAKPA
jgi:hypothetical protein